jgi:hypothetical protein
MKIAACLVALVVAGVAVMAQAPARSTPSAAQIKKAIIEASLASYSGNCPCPYNLDRAGRKCGKRSAYTSPGGAAPICYEDDISAAMVDAYRKRAAK